MKTPLDKLCEEMLNMYVCSNPAVLKKAAEIIKVQAEALEFYADEGNLSWYYTEDKKSVKTAYEEDEGDKARAAAEAVNKIAEGKTE